MILLSVNCHRFTGSDDAQTANSDKHLQAEQILEKLHKQAELRRQEREAVHGHKRRLSQADDGFEVEKVTSIKKNKEGAGAAKKNKDKKVEKITEHSDADALVTTPVLPESSHTDVSATNADVGFTVLGEAKPRTLKKAQRVLPAWLANPSVVSTDIRTDRVHLTDVPGLDTDMIKLLCKNGIKKFFPVQAQVIPALLYGGSSWQHLAGPAGYQPRDICCSAPTGSGKTLAYVIPVVQILRRCVVRRVRCLVVVPVGDLAAQVHKVFLDYCQHTNLRVGVITGMKPFVQEQSALVKKGVRGYQSQVDIVVCTPGRLVDHINKTSGFDLTHLRFLVIDEADRMMDEIKQDWLSLVDKAVYHERSAADSHIYLSPCQRLAPGPLTLENMSNQQIPLQKLLFSATLSHDPEKLNHMRLFQPLLFTSVVKHEPLSSDVALSKSQTRHKKVKTPGSEVEVDFVGKYTTPVGLSESFIECSKMQKPLALLYILRRLNFKHVLCFTNSIDSTHRLFHVLRLVGGTEVRDFSSRLQASRRNRILRQFAAGKINVLISTDAMSRGIDVTDIDCVVSYDVPRVFTTYVHRVGRTARAGRPGTAFTLLEKREIFHFKKLLHSAGKTGVKEMKFKYSELKEFVRPVQQALNALPAILKTEAAASRRSHCK